MRKFQVILGVTVVLCIVCLVLARLTGAIQIYKIPTPSSEPTIKVGDIVVASNLRKPKPGNTIAYKSEYTDSLIPILKPGEIHLHRLVAAEGDILEMKEGVLYLNGENYDKQRNLLYDYVIDKKAIDLLPNAKELDEKGMLFVISSDSAHVFLTTNQVAELSSKGIAARKNIVGVEYNSQTENGAFSWCNKNSEWSVDRFGPLKIPTGYYFVMGDNRHNSLDSRYVGFIKKENFRGTVLNK
jgi:signal peptidase I